MTISCFQGQIFKVPVPAVTTALRLTCTQFRHQTWPLGLYFLLISCDGGFVTASCRTPAISWTVACQAPLSMGFSRQEHWGDLPLPPPGDLLDPGIKPRSPALQADSLLIELSRNPKVSCQNPGIFYTIHYWIYFFTTSFENLKN